MLFSGSYQCLMSFLWEVMKDWPFGGTYVWVLQKLCRVCPQQYSLTGWDPSPSIATLDLSTGAPSHSILLGTNLLPHLCPATPLQFSAQIDKERCAIGEHCSVFEYWNVSLICASTSSLSLLHLTHCTSFPLVLLWTLSSHFPPTFLSSLLRVLPLDSFTHV